jgi:tRNA(adenine34) deaminase
LQKVIHYRSFFLNLQKQGCGGILRGFFQSLHFQFQDRFLCRKKVSSVSSKTHDSIYQKKTKNKKIMNVDEKEDQFFMREALKEAKKAYKEGEVPVGAVLVLKGKVIARGHNQVELLKDATAHAEMLCMGSGAQALDNWRLLETTLYCTVEPCIMCAGAMYLSRIKRLVWGTYDVRHGAHGSLVNLFDLKHPTHQIEVTGRILAEECALPLQEFFRERRNNSTA